MADRDTPRSFVSGKAMVKRAERARVLAGAIEQRCEASNIPVALRDGPIGPRVAMELPSGRSRRKISVAGLDRLEQLLSVPFEKYVVLGQFLAIGSYEDGTVEALVEGAGQQLPRRILSRRISGHEGGDESTLLSLSRGGVELTLGNASPDLVVLLHRGAGALRQAPKPLALRITGLEISRHETALDRLEAIANGLFLELDARLGLPLLLSRVRRLRPARRPAQEGADGLEFPISEYDPQAMTLYSYGRGATGMPLLQFLAFYQVLEFYFPIYADQEARRRVKSIVKDPAFKPHSEGHISKVMKAMNTGGRRGFGDERSQLRATIRACMNPDILREYLKEQEDRTKYFEERKSSHSPASTLIKPEMDDDDLLDATSERIYEIRCRIVHTKDSDGDQGQLLPFSPEAERMGHDIDLLESLARSALVAGSRELRL